MITKINFISNLLKIDPRVHSRPIQPNPENLKTEHFSPVWSAVHTKTAFSGFLSLKTELFEFSSFYIKLARLNCYKHYFLIRIVKLWNNLPRDLVEAESFQIFKSNLKYT